MLFLCNQILLFIQIIWEPYTEDVIQQLSAYCLQGRDIWRALVPLICIHIIEWHCPNRVLRQFGYVQPIPRDPYRLDALHYNNFRDHDTDWAEKHAQWILLWGRRAHNVVVGQLSHGSIHYHSQYLDWFRSVTRRWISPISARLAIAVSFYISFSFYI